MAKFAISRYAKTIETFTVEADNEAHAVVRTMDGQAEFWTSEFIEYKTSGMTRGQFSGDGWECLFDLVSLVDEAKLDGHTLASIARVENRDTGERWDDFWGYQAARRPKTDDKADVFCTLLNDPADREPADIAQFVNGKVAQFGASIRFYSAFSEAHGLEAMIATNHELDDPDEALRAHLDAVPDGWEQAAARQA